MEEFAKSLQYTTHLILGLSAALLLFAYPPASRSSDRRHLATFTTLRAVGLDGFDAFAKETINNRFGVLFNRLVSDFEARGLLIAYRLPTDLQCVSVMTPRIEPLSGIVEWLGRTWNVAVFIPGDDAYIAIAKRVAEVRISEPNARPRLLTFRFSQPRATTGPIALLVPAVLEWGRTTEVQVSGQVTYMDLNDEYLSTIKLSRAELLEAIGTEFLADSSKAAVERLELGLTRAQGQISFLGLSVPSDAVGFVGLIALVIILFYLAGHVSQLLAEFRYAKPSELAPLLLLRRMPWVGFMPGRIGLALTAIFVAIAPSTATFFLAYELGKGYSLWFRLVLWSSVPLVIVTCAWVLCNTLKVRSKLESPAARSTE